MNLAYEQLLEKIQFLDTEITRLQCIINNLSSKLKLEDSIPEVIISSYLNKHSASSAISIKISKVISERKPISINLKGIFNETINLSEIRAAIFLVLFTDLKLTLERGYGLKNISYSIIDVFKNIKLLNLCHQNPQLSIFEEKEINIKESTVKIINSAFYRLEVDLLEGKFLNSVNYALKIDKRSKALSIINISGSAIHSQSKNNPKKITVEIVSDIKELCDIYSKLLNS